MTHKLPREPGTIYAVTTKFIRCADYSGAYSF